MLADKKSDTQNKGPWGMTQSDGFPSNIAREKEQYHNRHKGRVRPGMKLDNNGDYGDEGES